MDPDGLRDLADTIARHGLLHPITVRTHGTRFEVIAGARRAAAFELLGKSHIPAYVRDAGDAHAAVLKFTENRARTNLTVVEEAHALARMLPDHDDDVAKLAAHLGVQKHWTARRLEILSFPQDLIAALADNRITLAAARPLALITEDTARGYYLDNAINQGASGRTTSAWAQAHIANTPFDPATPPPTDPGQPRPPPPQITQNCFGCAVIARPADLTYLPFCVECARTLAAQSRVLPTAGHPAPPR